MARGRFNPLTIGEVDWDALPHDDARLAVACRLAGEPSRDVAGALHYSPTTVHAWLRQARRPSSAGDEPAERKHLPYPPGSGGGEDTTRHAAPSAARLTNTSPATDDCCCPPAHDGQQWRNVACPVHGRATNPINSTAAREDQSRAANGPTTPAEAESQ